ncbi:MAG: hypothetical protein H0W40_11535 [Methylibium sp.]|uniref:hypothetical protein n=1 Tax=Methylibium sp. TaxID=2067992 RepID=UPI0017D84F6E|nr:hypothetical protein [Methylibium sp.]MBA3597989.1 hypothetical protein [Methylibium sp.]
MIHISTTATVAEKLKRRAKTLRKETGTSLAVAQDAVAKQDGYRSWKHLTVCAERTRTMLRALPLLPKLLVETLAAEAKRQPPGEQSVLAFRSGLVFAMDVKDADGIALGDYVVECDDAWTIAAADIWGVFVHTADETPSHAETMEPDELLEAAHEDLMNYRLFRYTGASTPVDLNDAFRLVLRRYFFVPAYVWLKGKFIDMASVPEVRVDGKAIYQTNLSAEQLATYASLPLPPPATSAATTAPTYPPRRDMVCRLDVRKLEPGLYESRMSYGNQAMFSDAGFTTIREAIESVSLSDGPVYAVEVAYEGLVVGTYAPEALAASAEMIAKHAVSTLSGLRDR